MQNFRKTTVECCMTCAGLVLKKAGEDRPVTWLECVHADPDGLDVYWHVNRAADSVQYVCDEWVLRGEVGFKIVTKETA